MQLHVQTAIRLGTDRLKALLDKLDAEPEFRSAVNQRRHERYPYRDRSIVIELADGDDATRLTGVTRNISRNGMGLVVGRFVYANTRCRVRLISEHNSSETVTGVVQRCRYLSGTVGVHDLGVQFDRPIDIELYVPAAKSVRVLVLDDDPMQQRVLLEVFKRIHAEVTVATNPAAAADTAFAHPFDLIVFGMLGEAEEFIRGMRDKGYVRPIASVGTLAPQEIDERCAAMKCRACRPFSLSSEGLLRLIKLLEIEPIVSLNGGSPAAQSLIHVFVQSAPDRIVQMEQAFCAKDWTKLPELARRTAFLAESAGFEPIAMTASELASLAHAAADAVEIREKLAELIQQCRAARAMRNE